MPILKSNYTKKHLTIVLVLLVLLTAIPLNSAKASVDLLYFRAVPGSNSIKLEWKTAQELDNLGFNLYRGLTSDFNSAQKLNSSLIPGNTGSTTPVEYEWPDTTVQIGTQYTYWLEDIDIYGNPNVHDPVTSSTSSGGTIPTIPSGGGGNTATPTPTKTPTRTPSPTATQSGSNATATPTRTPTRAATTNAPNPTNTAIPQTQATANVNNQNQSPTSAVQSAATVSVNPAEGEEPKTTPMAESETLETTTNTAASNASPTPQSISESPNESGDGNQSSITQIGQNGGEEQAATVNNAGDPDDSNGKTMLVIALVVSVVLLFVGSGGIIALVFNRSKQPRI